MLGSTGTEINRWVKRRRWDMQRFGMTPGRVLRNRQVPKIVLISMPKAGTHLLERALCLHPDLHRMLSRKVMGEKSVQLRKLKRLLERQRPGQLICGHISYSPEAAQLITDHRAVIAFIVRDPRDVVVSHAHYIANFTGHEWNHAARSVPNLDDRIRMFVDGGGPTGTLSIRDGLRRYSGWLDEANATVRYEEMIDPRSGPGAIAKLFGDLGMNVSSELARSISERLVSPVSVTFRKGKSGGWRDEMDSALQARFMESAGEDLRTYGYR